MNIHVAGHDWHRMSRRERDSWSELQNLVRVRAVALTTSVVAVALAIVAFGQSAVLGLVMLLATPLMVLAAVTLADALLSSRE